MKEMERKNRKGGMPVLLVVALIAVSSVLLLPVTVAQQATVAIDDGSAAPTEEDIVSIMINDVPVDIMTADITLTYDSSVVHVMSVSNSQFDNLDSNINNGTGSTRIAAYQAASDALTGNVKLCDVTLKAVGSAGESSPLTITVTRLEAGDESVITATADDGTFTIPEVPPATTGDVIINEIMYAPTDTWGGQYNEWIELYNNGSKVNITGWAIDGKTIPEAILDPGDYLIIARNDTKFGEFYPSVTCPVIKVTIGLNDGGETIFLNDSMGNVNDSVDYTDYASGGLGWGYKDNYTLELNATGGWEESSDEGGTPCQLNSVLVPYGVELDVDEIAKTIVQGETATYTLTVKNIGTLADTINLTVDGIGTLSNDSLMLDAGASEDVILEVTSAVVDDHVTNVTATSQGDVNKTANVTVTTTVEAIRYEVSLTEDAGKYNDTVAPDKIAMYTLTVRNTGNVNDTIDLTIDNPANASLSKATTNLLQPGETDTVYLNVSSANTGKYIRNVTATSVGNGSISDTKMFTTIVAEIYDVSLTEDAGKYNDTVAQNEIATYMLTVRNTGNVNDTFNLTIDNLANASLSKTVTAMLQPDATDTVYLNVSSANTGKYIRNVTATSVGNGSISDTKMFTTMVVDRTSPVVTITSPVEGATFTTATITVSGAATDNVEVTSIEVNGVSVAITPGPNVPFSTSVTLVSGANTITVVASDSALNNGSDTVNVTYNPPVGARGGGGGSALDTDGDGYSDIVEWLQGSDPDDPCDPDPNSAACLALGATPTPATPTPATPKPTMTPVPTPVTTPTTKPAATPTPTPEEPGFGAVFAITGLLAIAYVLLRRKQE